MISVTILTKNSQKHIVKVLQALRVFDEVVLYDTGSSDETLALGKKFPNVNVYQGRFIGFGPTHNAATAKAKYDWILSIDSDEVVSDQMAEEILQYTELNPQCVYSFPRHNYFNGKWIKWCGWYPDRCLRLYHRNFTCFSDDQVHERVLSDHRRVVALKGPIKHYSYETMDDFLLKMHHYTDLFSKQYAGKKNSSLIKAISRGFFAFFKSYVIKKGFLGGQEGMIISLYNGHTAYYKYLKLLEANCKQIQK